MAVIIKSAEKTGSKFTRSQVYNRVEEEVQYCRELKVFSFALPMPCELLPH